ncbi:Hypothetical Protein FCC1311_027382 [Hondaea fermentalgiana]|uniref:Uncharacterized protein n=1 Tax=Hondaea fermentalgiana TaxID=2315210 RepID=A0A2R5G634_9STRA|nr:Hypothetical Protein FCC1311_027382 [Hondaea fermentalgiana]|eukprot:GBG26517.1 Hypothetical Protein FCC1311_027382 [Hondaea fermentalgiana]
MPLRVSQLEPQQTSKKLLMSKSHERLAKITMKGMRSMAAKDSRHKSPTQFDLWPKSTFGVGRTPVDGWGRGVEPRFPGPGAYDAAPEGTFEAKRRATENISSFAEAAHLGATERRLENLRQLQIKHRKGILDIAEKGIYESESRPSTVDRLQRRKEHFKGLLESKSKCFDDMFRPRTSYVLPCQAIASRRARRSPKPSRALQAPSYELPPTRPVSRQVIFSGDNPSGSSFADEPDGAYPALLSNYEFATASLPASEAYGFGLLDVDPSLANSNPIAFGAGKLGLQHGSGAATTDDEGDDYDDEFDDDKSAYADGDNGTSGDARNDNPRRRRGHRDRQNTFTFHELVTSAFNYVLPRNLIVPR